MKVTFLGLRLGVVSRKRGGTALLRSCYQASGVCLDATGRRREFSLENSGHRETIVLLPRDAPEWDRQSLWLAAGAAERRSDSIEARVVDFQIPRGVPDELVPDLARALFCIFARTGLPVQIDFHCPAASDQGQNPHLHALIGTRRLRAEGFESKKARIWDAIFRRDSGRYVRRRFASAFNRFCATHELPVRIDPRPNSERGLPAPELRLPRWTFKSSSPASVQNRTALRACRAARAALERAEREAAAAKAAADAAHAAARAKANALLTWGVDGDYDSKVLAADIADALIKAGIGRDRVYRVTPSVAAIRCNGASILVQGASILLDGRASPDALWLFERISSHKSWRNGSLRGSPSESRNAIFREARRWGERSTQNDQGEDDCRRYDDEMAPAGPL